MNCGSCSVGGCSTGGKSCGCNKKSVYNWLADLPEPAYRSIIPVEVSFKDGARKEFYQCKTNFDTLTGDYVVVEAEGGYDIGRITMSGELVKLQMKKKGEKTKLPDLPKVIRKGKEQDIAKLKELREKEKDTLRQARVIARKLNLDMKIGDIEYQGNGRKVTIFYTADGRVDFRQLIREYAQAFQVKIEMKQIGMRQESARVGGIGSCGRELCCSTWIDKFKSVSTSAARYQSLSINQTKLSGQCGRLKCCLNYELDTYLASWKTIPKKVDKLQTEEGVAFLVKTDVLRQELHYRYDKENQFIKLKASDVADIKKLNEKGEKPTNLFDLAIKEKEDFLEKEEDLVGSVILEPIQSKRNKRRKPYKGKPKGGNKNPQNNSGKPKQTKKTNPSNSKKTHKKPSRAQTTKTNPNNKKDNPNKNINP